MKKIESVINYYLIKFPLLKKIIKRIYQMFFTVIFHKINADKNVVRLSPADEYEYFFGYYDKSPWSPNGRYLLYHKVKCTYKDVAPASDAIIILQDQESQKILEIASTSSWNNQQGAMLQWIGFSSNEIVFNDYDNESDKFISRIINIESRVEKIINKPLYAVSNDGQFGISLDFSRLHDFRRGYGYSNKKSNIDEKVPNDYCLFLVDIIKDENYGLLKYDDLVSFNPKESMTDATHMVNHIMISPDQMKFMFLHRWKKNNKRYSRLCVFRIDSGEIDILADEDLVSHCWWHSNDEVISFMKWDGNVGYFLIDIYTKKVKRVFSEISNDGHPSRNIAGNYVFDSYPDRYRMMNLYLSDDFEKFKKIAYLYSPFRYDNDYRCDLHPRWSFDGTKIAFDSVYEGKRRLYMIDIGVEKNVNDSHSNV